MATGGASTIDGGRATGGDTRAILDALQRIEARLGRLEALAGDAITEGRGALAIVTDTADRTIAGLSRDGVDVDARLQNLALAAERLSSDEAVAMLNATFGRLDAIQAVLESGVLAPSAVAIVAKAGKALAEAADEPADGVGAFGLMRALGEPEVRAATGLLVRFARKMGRALSEPARLPSGDGESGR